ncbi:MarR family transcriptional regulator [Robertkochia marina]|uniref:MarR family transcriptional regulator n=1 Tax=Robertkochia marina TaxID=1227945 RepID=A0A4S3LXV1_9FLAO|nr:MarR family transcriptional regulator [Robertkochia marina]THD66400.1 MarR family transcriptional regulator [Robertkochia marina]TRZ44079.1 MarR family transcriptional regulator [Robertkochia marina]
MKIEEIIKSASMPLARKTVINIIYTANVLSEQSSDTLKQFGLTLPQFNVLRILRGQKGKPANLSTIQDRMVNKMSNTTRLVDKLIDKGLAVRVICQENRRKVEISITDKGLQLLSQIDAPMDRLNDQAVAQLSEEELNLFNDMLEKIRE